jgi:aminobenzoyl-glutamate utilization protein B
MIDQDDILKLIEDKRQKYIDASLDIWDYAEPIFEEYKSAKRLADLLQDEGFTVNFGVAGMPTAFVAEWGSGEPIVGYMAEYDALPGISQEADTIERKPLAGNGYGHGCGHHVLGTAAVAAAIATKDYLEQNHQTGTVRLYGCPAEEGGGGKVIMNNAGLFSDCAAAISWHATDDNGIWSINFHAQQKVEITFRGKSADGFTSNSLDALQMFILGAQNLRHHLDPCFVVRSSILKTGDDNPSKVPEESRILYAYRAHSGEQIRRAMSLLQDVARGAACMAGCDLVVNYKTGYSEMLPNRSLERLMYEKYQKVGTVPMVEADWEYARKMHMALPEGGELATFDLMRLLYAEQADPIIKRVKGKPYNNLLYPFREINVHKPGSTDICDVSWTTPTTQCVVACYAKDTLGHSWQEVAQGRSDICMKGMLVAAKVMALTGIELFARPTSLKAVRDEFRRERTGKIYLPLNAREVTENVSGLGDQSEAEWNSKASVDCLDDTPMTQVLTLDFVGTKDDGLAQRQTGRSSSILGNALEALEMFCIALEFNKKTIPASISWRSRILKTDDADMIRVPAATQIALYLRGDKRSDEEIALRRIYAIAHGAALMTGCTFQLQ